jgi:SAM-dependent methyltransferase
VSYFDWHREPGYWRDITRHFAPETDLLDVGCGTAWLADHFVSYTGIEGNPEAVRGAVERGRNVIQGDVEQPLPFEDASFGGAVLKDVLEHVRDPAAVVREVRRVLRTGALVFASSPDAQRWVWDDYTHVRPFTRQGYRRLFSDQGFEVVQAAYESVMPGIGIVSGRTRSHRRPAPLAAMAWLPVVRRNVTVLARRP